MSQLMHAVNHEHSHKFLKDMRRFREVGRDRPRSPQVTSQCAQVDLNNFPGDVS